MEFVKKNLASVQVEDGVLDITPTQSSLILSTQSAVYGKLTLGSSQVWSNSGSVYYGDLDTSNGVFDSSNGVAQSFFKGLPQNFVVTDRYANLRMGSASTGALILGGTSAFTSEHTVYGSMYFPNLVASGNNRFILGENLANGGFIIGSTGGYAGLCARNDTGGYPVLHFRAFHGAPTDGQRTFFYFNANKRTDNSTYTSAASNDIVFQVVNYSATVLEGLGSGAWKIGPQSSYDAINHTIYGHLMFAPAAYSENNPYIRQVASSFGGLVFSVDTTYSGKCWLNGSVYQINGNTYYSQASFGGNQFILTRSSGPAASAFIFRSWIDYTNAGGVLATTYLDTGYVTSGGSWNLGPPQSGYHNSLSHEMYGSFFRLRNDSATTTHNAKFCLRTVGGNTIAYFDTAGTTRLWVMGVKYDDKDTLRIANNATADFASDSSDLVASCTYFGTWRLGPPGRKTYVGSCGQGNPVAVVANPYSQYITVSSGGVSFYVGTNAGGGGHAGLLWLHEWNSNNRALVAVGYNARADIIWQNSTTFFDTDDGTPSATQVKVTYANANSTVTLTCGSGGSPIVRCIALCSVTND